MSSKSVLKTHQKIYLPIKRLIDILGSLIGMAICFVFLWWWIIPINSIVTKGHPFFVQKRIGKNKKIFNLIKFRSMKVDANPNLSPADMNEHKQLSMETKFGKFLRSSSFDETMQLFNIFIGNMAFVGPRPGAAVNEERLIKAREQYKPNAYDVKPGLTGLAQVKMHREHDPEFKAKWDHEYVKHMSIWMDTKLFVLTILRLFGVGKGR